MKKQTQLNCLFVLCVFFCGAQSTNPEFFIDSLKNELSKAKTDTARINLLDLLSFNYHRFDFNVGLEYGHKAESLSVKINWKRGIANANNDLGLNYEAKCDYPQGLSHFLKALKVYKEIGDRPGMAAAYANIGHFYLAQSDPAKALENNFSALKLYENMADAPNKAIVQENIGTIYLQERKHEKALEYYNLALANYKKIDDKEGMARNLGNQGIILNEKGDYTGALNYHLSALSVNKETGNLSSVQINLANLGITYGYLKEYSKALSYHLQALELSEELKDKRSIAVNLGNAGEVYYLMAANPSMRSSKTKNIHKAIEFLNKSLSICGEINFMGPYLEFSSYLSDTYTLARNEKMALEVFKKYSSVKDSMAAGESKLKIAAIEARRQLELKDKDIILKSQQIEIQTLESINKRNERLMFLFCISLLLLIILFLYRFLLLRSRKHKHVLNDVANIQSHEVRAPLARILGLVQIVDKNNLTPENEHIIRYIDQSAHDLDTVIRKIVNRVTE
jgi:tetratricopeptide (TPR) repeat protein